MTTAKSTLAHGLILGLAVVLTGTAAEAGHYRHIDNHARDIEREAERAETVVRRYFHHAPAPLTHFLDDSLHNVARTAHQLHELSRRSGNTVAIEILTARLDGQVHDVLEGVTVLREWVTGCHCSVRRFASSFNSCHPRSSDRRNLASLIRRTDEMDDELHDLKNDLKVIMADYNRAHPHASHGHVSTRSRVLLPAPVPRDSHRVVIPLGTYERPGHDFSHGRTQSRSRTVFSFGSHSSRHGHHSESAYIHTRIGGFGLSFRLR